MKNIKTQFLDISTSFGECDCFVAYPEITSPLPAVILFMDIYGPRKYLYEMSERLAGLGFYVLLPNIFYRHKKVPLTDAKFPLDTEARKLALPQVLPFLKSLNPHETMKDVGSFIDELRKNPLVKNSPIGVTGYCMGGSLALRAAATFPHEIGAAASFHGGGLVTDSEDSVHLQLKNIRGEIYVAHADQDQSMNSHMIDLFESAMKDAGVKGKSETYVGAEHGFTMLDLPAGNSQALIRHWENLERLFKAL